ncbi:MAG TPA: thioredoxin [Acidimicrobiales bacterium]|nr:thioredoxin [Acidimicrobiales bacterium]
MPTPSPPTTATVVACPACGKRNRIAAAAKGSPRCAACHEPLPWLVEADDEDFDLAISGPLPVLLDLWAPWCGPCRAVAPIVEELSRSLAGRLKVVKVDVDRAPRTAQRLGVQGVPTMLILQDGQVAARQVGALPGPALRNWVAQNLSRQP